MKLTQLFRALIVAATLGTSLSAHLRPQNYLLLGAAGAVATTAAAGYDWYSNPQATANMLTLRTANGQAYFRPTWVRQRETPLDCLTAAERTTLNLEELFDHAAFNRRLPAVRAWAAGRRKAPRVPVGAGEGAALHQAPQANPVVIPGTNS